MCNCGHDDLEEARRLKQRSVAVVLCALGLGFVLLGAAHGHAPVLWLGLAVQAMLLFSAVRLMQRRRRLICGEAR